MPKEVKIKFTESTEYKIYPATGVWGGPGPDGTFVIDFFVERLSVPEEMVLEFEMGKAPKEMSRTEQGMVRERQVGVVMRPDVAKAVGKFLIDKADKVLAEGKGKKVDG